MRRNLLEKTNFTESFNISADLMTISNDKMFYFTSIQLFKPICTWFRLELNY